MARRAYWCLPFALALAACQAPQSPLSGDATNASILMALPGDNAYRIQQAWDDSSGSGWSSWGSGNDSSNESPYWNNQGGSYGGSYGGGSYGGGAYGGSYPVHGSARTGDASRFYPDLTAVAPRTFYVDSGRPGKRYFRFSTAIANTGPGHLQVRGTVEGNVTRGTQEILDDDGRVVQTKDVGTFELHPDHGHFHVGHVARYELRRGGLDGTLLQNGRKISFCMEDSFRFTQSDEVSRVPDCSRTMQGITRSFADLYSAGLPDQTFDITGMAPGTYTIVIYLDPQKKFLETSRNNNMAWLRVRLDPAGAKAYREASYP